MTTIKRYLDDWKAHQQTARPPAIDLPDEVAAKGRVLTPLEQKVALRKFVTIRRRSLTELLAASTATRE